MMVGTTRWTVLGGAVAVVALLVTGRAMWIPGEPIDFDLRDPSMCKQAALLEARDNEGSATPGTMSEAEADTVTQYCLPAPGESSSTR